MDLTSNPQILIVAAAPALAGSLVRRVREFGVSAVAKAALPAADEIAAFRGIIVAEPVSDGRSSYGSTPPQPPAALSALMSPATPPVLALGDGFAACWPADGEHRWRPMNPGQTGFAQVRVDDRSPLWRGTDLPFPAWFRRSAVLAKPPEGYRITAWDADGNPVGLDDETGHRFAIQFHPQRSGSEAARQMLRRFVRDVCGCPTDWRLPEQIPLLTDQLQQIAGPGGPLVVLISGGVASMVTVALAKRALGADRVVAVHVDTGLLRHGESERVLAAAQGLDLHRVALTDVADTVWPLVQEAPSPEAREAIIAQGLLTVARQTAGRIGLADQPILVGNPAPWPDESGVMSPLQAYDRSEWVQLGRALGVPDDVLIQPPFPLAALAARCDGELTPQRLATLRRADERVMADLARHGGMATLTHVAVRLTLPAPGRDTLIIEANQADDGLSAQPFEAPAGFWAELAERLRSALPGIRHVYLDLAPSPAGELHR